jgi:hypothetical protein
VKAFWRDYRQAVKEAEREHGGGSEINSGKETVGWGVKEADERNRAEAGECI